MANNEIVIPAPNLAVEGQGQFFQSSLPVPSESAPVPSLEPVDDELLRDIEYARGKQKDLIDQGHDSLPGLVDLADQSQHPRSYEVLSGMLKTLSEMNKDYVNIALGKSAAKSKNNFGEQKVYNQSVNFVGTTKDLADMLKGLK